MPKPTVKLLTDALRSGEYVQGKNRLRSLDDKFCCLGVACDIAVKNGVGIPVYKDAFDGGCYKYDGMSGIMPEVVAEFFGMRMDGGFYDATLPNDMHTINNQLTTLNDNGATFEDIATLIESEPEGLFVNDSKS